MTVTNLEKTIARIVEEKITALGLPKRRYASIDWVEANYPFSRRKLYYYIEAGAIKSYVLRQDPAKRRGKRIVDLESLDSFIESQATEEQARSQQTNPEPVAA
jgi:hypothetical protein